MTLSVSIKEQIKQQITTQHLIDVTDDVLHAAELSEYFALCAQQYPWFLSSLLPTTYQSPLPGYQELLAEFRLALSDIDNEAELNKQLRHWRHRYQNWITLRDYFCDQDIIDSCRAVNDLAQALIIATYEWWYQHFSQRYAAPIDGQHLYILGMGKLGGGELNFSSDIDLIFLYPSNEDILYQHKSIEHQQFFTKLGQKLIHSLNQTTVDGFVYRVDMRLRPFGESGPLVLPFAAFESYLYEQGRSWERFALLKAAVLNPHDEHVDYLHSLIKPFVYRRFVDFSVIDSLREMKRLIQQESRRLQRTNNIKLGPGGIREAEFIVQCLQLIHGGRIANLQVSSIAQALQQLAEHALLPAEDIVQLSQSYWFLRTVEQRLQQYQNGQTQTLLEDMSPIFQSLHVNEDAFVTQLNIAQGHISRIFNDLIALPEEQQNATDTLYQQLYDATELSEELAEILPHANYWPIIQSAKQKLNYAPMGERGALLMDKLMPMMLAESIVANLSSAAFEQALAVIINLHGRTTYLELVYENPGVRQQLIQLAQNSHWLMTQLVRFPILLDELLAPSYLADDDQTLNVWREQYQTELRQHMLRIDMQDIEAVGAALRQFKLAQVFRVAAADITGHLATAKVSDKLTLLAEVLLHFTLQVAWQLNAEKFGLPPKCTVDNMGLCLIGYGKLGGWEMGYQSDCDVVFIHQQDPQAETDGEKVISTQQFYVKVVQKFMTLCNTKTLLGELYEIDLRLRPNGNSGLLVSHLDTFSAYQQEDAWLWEHQALLRARVVLGNDQDHSAFARVRSQIICRPRTHAALRQEIVAMRQKMRQHLAEKDKGSIVDIEFMVQYLCLLHAANFPQLIQFSDNLRQIMALAEVDIITANESTLLCDAYLALRHDKHQRGILREVANNHSLTAYQQKISALWQRYMLD